MRTFLLTWNPKRWEWQDLDEVAQGARPDSPFVDRWSCGTRKDIQPGERVFLLRQGLEPRGIMGSGRVLSAPYADEHWDQEKATAGETANFIAVEFDRVLNPSADALLSATDYPELAGRLDWNTQQSGTLIQPDNAEILEAAWARHALGGTQDDQPPSPGPDDEAASFPEGREVWRLHRQRERSSRLVSYVKYRAAHDRNLQCQVCGFDFEKAYGKLGRGYIEAHHTFPVSMLSSETPTRVSDIALVCSNCHKMLHRRRPWLSLEDLKAILNLDA